MKVLVTGVGGQLGHDVMNELAKRGYEGVGSDIKETYSGVLDGTPVVSMPYVPMNTMRRLKWMGHQNFSALRALHCRW